MYSNFINKDKIKRIKKEYKYIIFIIYNKINILYIFFLKRKFELSYKMRKFLLD